MAQIAKKPPIDKSKPSAAPALALSAPPPQSATPAAHEGVTLISAATIEPEAIDWLWHSHIALGKLSILAGVAGTGKSTVAFNLAAIVSVGGMWPDGSKCPTAGNVLIWSGEDDPADTIIPRLMAADADLSRIHIITGGKAADGTSLPFDPASDVTLLCDEIKRIGGAALMIIDPIVSAVAGDMHKANDVRRGLQAIIDLSAAFDCAVVGVSHFSKGSGGASPQERVIGSQAFAALARLVLVCAKDEGSSTRVLMRAKSNISVDHGGFKYGILPVTVINRKEPARPIGTTKVEWGEALRGNAREILKSLEPDTEHAGGKNDECAQSMRAMLTGSDGSPIEVPSSDVQAKLCEQGYSEKCIRKAKERLGVTHRREGFGGGSYWRLPVPTPMVRSAAFLTTKSP
ncbi:MAG: AAA family ATPase [Steroidobacteraceae bacterium]